MTPAEFKAQFPEFASIDNPTVTAELSAAALEVDCEVWGAKADLGIALLAAHNLITSPMGAKGRLEEFDDSPYLARFDRLKRGVATGWRVVK